MSPTRFAASLVLALCLLLPSWSRADDPPPPLTKKGLQWGKALVKNAMAEAAGRPQKKPPFITDHALAEAITLVVNVGKKNRSVDLAQDADFLTLNALITDHVRAGERPQADDLDVLYQALNQFSTTFPPPASPLLQGRAACSPSNSGSAFLGFLSGLARLFKVTKNDGRLTPPSGGTPADECVVYMNGIANTQELAEIAAAHLTATLGVPVSLLYNASTTALVDVLETVSQARTIFKGSLLPDSRAVKNLAAVITECAKGGRRFVGLCHSQGAGICARAMTRALTDAPSDDARQLIQSRASFISMGGFLQGSSFPPGTDHLPLRHPADAVPSLGDAIDWPNLKDVPLAMLHGLFQLLALPSGAHSLTETYVARDCDDATGPCVCANDCAPGPPGDLCRQVKAALQGALTKCGDGVLGSKQCDPGTPPNIPAQDAACPGQCIAAGLTNQCTCEPIQVEEVSTRSGWTGDVLATRRKWSSGGQEFVEVVRYGVTKRICPASGVSLLDCNKSSWNVWKFVPLSGYFISPGAAPPGGAAVTIRPDNVITESCEDLDPQRRFSSGPENCPLTVVNDGTFVSSSSPSYYYPLCYSTHSCAIYDPASPYLGQVDYTAELMTGCTSEECPASYSCPDLRCPSEPCPPCP
jgi:hypothetical protein